MKNKNKTILLISILAIILIGVVGVAYAYSGLFTGNNQQLVLGDIYMHYTESNVFSLANAMPSESYDTSNYFEFTINGKNTYNKDIYYEIVLNHGDDHATRTERIQDSLLKFTLVEIKDNTEKVVADSVSYDEINNTRIWVNTISKNTESDVNVTYRLYMWISSDTTICGEEATGCDYDMDTWNDEVYASIKVNVLGDFESKSIGPSTAAEYIIAKVGTDGLVAINTDGGLYSGTGTIREYRYSGTDVNNYVYFNCKDSDGTYNYGDENYDYANNCETWRVVGIFEEDGEQVVKIMRNTMLTDAEVPITYTINGTTYTIISASSGGSDYEPTIDNLPGSFMTYGITKLATSTTPATIVWNSKKIGTNYNDWTTSGLQYYLNTLSDTNNTTGYLGTLADSTKNLIRTTTYNLGNVTHGSSGATAITAYNQESGTTICASSVTSNSNDNSCNIWYGNQPTWSGKVALLYPSDYGYAASSSYWSTALYSYAGSSITAANWMQAEANHRTYWEWFLSPSSSDAYGVMYWYSTGYINVNTANANSGARPCLYLVSTTKILQGTGESSSPYVVVAS